MNKVFEDMSLFEQMAEINRLAKEILDPIIKPIPQQDRTLSDGRVKSSTGYVDYPVSESIHDFPRDLPNNRGF